MGMHDPEGRSHPSTASTLGEHAPQIGACEEDDPLASTHAEGGPFTSGRADHRGTIVGSEARTEHPCDGTKDRTALIIPVPTGQDHETRSTDMIRRLPEDVAPIGRFQVDSRQFIIVPRAFPRPRHQDIGSHGNEAHIEPAPNEWACLVEPDRHRCGEPRSHHRHVLGTSGGGGAPSMVCSASRILQEDRIGTTRHLR